MKYELPFLRQSDANRRDNLYISRKKHHQTILPFKIFRECNFY